MNKNTGSKKAESVWRRHKLAFGLLGASLLLIILGLLSGEYGSVLEKAITVCLDCIGIG